MADGYIAGKKPDAAWWMDRIQEGLKYREEVAFEQSWDRWHAYMRGEWAPGVLPNNLFFKMMRTIVPRVYFRNPSVSIVSTKPGPLFMGFAKLLERVDAKLLRQMRLKKQLKRMVQDTFHMGTGIGTLGFGAEYEYAHEGFVEAPLIGNQGESLEYKDHVVPNMPWFSRVHPRNYVVPAMSESLEDSRWTTMFVERSLHDVKRDSRLSKRARNSIGAGRFGKSNNNDTQAKRFSKGNRSVDMVQLGVIRDKKYQRVIVMAPGGGKNSPTILYDGSDVLQADGFPDFAITFNPDNEYFWGVPDSQILEPQQLEMNEIRTQTMYHRRISMIKFLLRKGEIDPGEVAKLLSPEVGAAIWVNGDPEKIVARIKAGEIPPELFAAEEQILRDVRDTVGFSRNQLGEYNSQTADTTATEANIVKQGSEIRVDERRDEMADMLVDIVEGIHSLIFRKWTQQEIVQVTGPGGVPVWVQFTPQMLSVGQYNVKIDPDNALPETKQNREQKALALYNILKTNPIIDPFKLTQYVLHELHGTAFDDMMRILPQVGGGQTTDAEGFGGMIRESLNRTDGNQIVDKLAGRLAHDAPV